jgi:hypothetical protein
VNGADFWWYRGLSLNEKLICYRKASLFDVNAFRRDNASMDKPALSPESFANLRRVIANTGVMLAICFSFIWIITSWFPPGVDAPWYAFTILFAVAGLVSPNRRVRVIAVLVGVGLAGLSWSAYEDGLHYRLRQNHERALPVDER